MLHTGLLAAGVAAVAMVVSAPAAGQSGAARPSFSCSAARTHAERIICSEGGELARLDRIMAELFAQARSLTLNAGQSAELDQAQRAWLGERNACRQLQCVRNAYFRRIAVLTASLPDGS